MLRILSYNILFGNRVEEVIAWIASAQERFDILCFQEFPKEKISLVQKVLSPDAVSYASNVIYRGKDYGQLTVVQNKHSQLEEAIELQIGTNFFEDKVLRLRGQRSSLITKLRYHKKTILLANTHLIAFALNAKKREQLTMVVQYLEGMVQKGERTPVVVLGDLNYSSLFWRNKFFSLMDEHALKNAHTEKTHRLLSLKYHQLDYIFYRNAAITDVQILKQPFSDHLPMICQLHV